MQAPCHPGLLTAALSLSLLSASAGAQDARTTLTPADAGVPGRTEVQPFISPAPPGPAPLAAGTGQLLGWPKTIPGNGTFAPVRGLVFADLDQDGSKDVIVSSTDNRVYAWDAAGNDLPGFPRLLNNLSNRYAQTAPTVADLDRDGDLEIIQFNRGLTSGGRLFVLDSTGNNVPPFPLNVNGNNLAGTPCVYDLDDDGFLEILVPERDYPIGYLRVIELDGTEWAGGWPVTLDHVPTGTPGVADLDQDGSPEIVYLSYNSIFVVDAAGQPLPGWPQGIPGANFSYQSPALEDLDGDGDLEIVVGAHQSNAGVYAYQHDGSSVPGWPKLVGTWTYTAPTVFDVNGDGSPEVLSGREGFGPNNPSSCFWMWSAGGQVQPGFPYVSSLGGGSAGPITLADIDGDGVMEIFADHNIMQAGQGFLFGVDAAGNDLPGFPLRPTGFTYQNGAVIEDVDGDGDVELGVLSREGSNVYVNIYDLDEVHEPSRVGWGTYHKSNLRGGPNGPILHLDGSASLGGNLATQVVGEPGDFAYLWLGTSITHNNMGVGWVHLTQPFRRVYFGGAMIGASGQINSGQPIPNVPALAGLKLYFQSMLVYAGGGGRTSEMITVTIQ